MHKTILIGNLGADPEIRRVGYRPVANFSVAVNERWTNGEGKHDSRTVWYRVAAWGQLGEICKKNLAKGRKVYVEGRLIADEDTGGPRIWNREDGNQAASFELKAERIEFLDSAG